ncbi:MAG: ABC transporter ATP-binding protein [Lachnospiraceae bacterium]|nr:ABC transporter ATP-binding protein [Lachnospiraceae bacterium]
MIKAEHLTKYFGEFKALSDASLHVKEGSIYGLVGPNGAGKSTIIRHITGAMRADSGNVFVSGENVYENARVKSMMAYIPDDIFYNNSDTLIDLKNLYKGLYKDFDEELFKKMEECFPAIDVKKTVRSYSKGMQKQAAFYLSICTRPKIMILDEPVDGLDPVMRRQIWSIILSDVAENGTSVLISSHNLRELEDVCDHVGIMDHGKVILERSLEELQGNVTKFQMAFSGEKPEIPGELDVMHSEISKSLVTLIIRGNAEIINEKLLKLDPLFLDMIPLTLEEVFIYEMGGEGYDVKNISSVDIQK